jgi:parallel beta-helix repeat protein
MLINPVSMNVKANGMGGVPEIPPPEEDEPGEPSEFEYSIYISESSIFSMGTCSEIIVEDELTYVNFTFKNQGDSDVFNTMVDVYEVSYTQMEPEGGDLSRGPYDSNDMYLMTIPVGNLPPDGEMTGSIPWMPTESGVHSLRLSLSYVDDTGNLVYDEMVTFVVMQPDLPIIEMNEDWIIDEDTYIDNVTIILDADIIVNEGVTFSMQDSNIRAGNLDIWGEAIFTNVDFDLGCTYRGQFYIWVHDSGIFRVRGSSIFNNPPEYTYHFWVDGFLECREWGRWTQIMNVWGEDSGSSETGGIMLRNTDPSQQSTFRRTIIQECDTIGIGCYGSSPYLYPFVLLQFNGEILGPSPYGYGKGLYVEGSTADPYVRWCWIRYNNGKFNRGYGVRARDDASADILNSYIYGNTYSGIYCYYSSSGVNIQNNRLFQNTYYGIMDYRSSVNIASNTISETRYGIYSYLASTAISYNTISDNDFYGIVCSRSSATINDNTITENYYGILIYWTPSPTVGDDNLINSNKYLGIYVYYSSPTIQNNEIKDNSYMLMTHNFGGIYCYYSSPTIQYNDIISNDGWGIWMRYGAPTNAATIGIDNTYSPENLMGRVWQEWWMRVRTLDDDDGFVPDSYVEIIDQKSWPTPIWTGYSGSTGYTSTITVTEYIIPNMQTSKDYYTPHTIRAEKDVTDYVYTAMKLETIDDNKMVDINFDFSRFAVLIAPCRNPSEEQAFKGDISKMRDYLMDKGWQDSNIWFLTSGSETYVDGDATNSNVIAALDDIAARSSDQDIIYIQFVDHGGGYNDAYGNDFNNGGRLDGSAGDPVDEDDDSYCSIPGGGDSRDSLGRDYDGSLCTKDGYIYDDEFAAELNDILCRYMVVVPVACYSGDFIEDCSNDFTASGRIICTAAPENWYAWWSPPNYTYYAYYFHQGLTWTSSLGTHNPDTWYSVSNANGVIEVEEAHAYADEYDTPDEPKTWDWKTSTNLYLP